MTGNLKFMIGVVAMVVIIIFGAIFLSSGKRSIDPAKMGVGSLSLDKKSVDFGNMKSGEEKTTTFIVTNSGQTILRIWGVTTSCSCTFATIKIGNKDMGEFNMHEGTGLKDWLGEVPVGARAEVKVIYRPKVMPVVGKVSRTVIFNSNDPKNGNVELAISATVL